jgi:hypothetical protein
LRAFVWALGDFIPHKNEEKTFVGGDIAHKTFKISLDPFSISIKGVQKR